MFKLKTRPVGVRILVQGVEERDPAHGVIIPAHAKERPQEANVIALGRRTKGNDGPARASGIRVSAAPFPAPK